MDDAAEHEALHVAEWVSEVRRLYVEPKTRAQVRQEVAMEPLKRKLRLRGPRRTALPVDVEAGPRRASTAGTVETTAPGSLEPPASQAPPRETVAWDLKLDPASVPARVAPSVDPAPRQPPAHALPDVREASEPVDQQPAATWLLSYLEATGHRTDGEGSPASTASPATASAPVLEETPSTAWVGGTTDTLASQRLPEDVHTPVDVEQVAAEGQQPRAPVRSLAELAGVSAATTAYSTPTTGSLAHADGAQQTWSTTELDAAPAAQASVAAATVEADVDLEAPDTAGGWSDAAPEVEAEAESGAEPEAVQDWFEAAPERERAEDLLSSGLVSGLERQRSWDLPEPQPPDEPEAEPARAVVWRETDPVPDEALTDDDQPETQGFAIEPAAGQAQDWAGPESSDEVESESSVDVEPDGDLAGFEQLLATELGRAEHVAEPRPADAALEPAHLLPRTTHMVPEPAVLAELGTDLAEPEPGTDPAEAEPGTDPAEPEPGMDPAEPAFTSVDRDEPAPGAVGDLTEDDPCVAAPESPTEPDDASPGLVQPREREPVLVAGAATRDSTDPQSGLDDAQEAEPGSTEPAPEAALLPEAGAEREAEPEAVLRPELDPALGEVHQAEPNPVGLEPERVLGQAGQAPDLAEPQPESEAEEGTSGTRRPSEATSRVAVSWRGAGYFEGGPTVDDTAQLIVVEPPTQMVAATRRRRPEPRVAHDEHADAPPAGTDTTSTPTPDVSATADQEPADPPAGKSRWALVLAVLLVIVLGAVWFFLLRDTGSGSASPAARTGSAVVAVPPEKSADRLTLTG